MPFLFMNIFFKFNVYPICFFKMFFWKLKQICMKTENIKGIYRNERQIGDKYGEKKCETGPSLYLKGNFLLYKRKEPLVGTMDQYDQ